MCNSFFQIFLKKFLRGKIHSLFWGLNEIFSTKLGAKRAKSLPVFFQRGCQRINRSADSLPPSLEGTEAALRSAIALRRLGAQIVLACAQTYFAVLESALMRAQRLSTQKAGQKSGFFVFRIYMYI